MRIARVFLAILIAAGFCLARGVEARPLVPAERRYSPFDGIIPRCDDRTVLERIQSRFHDRESEFWSTGLDILGFEKIDEIGYRSNGLDHIPRRYCVARAVLNDEKVRAMSFSINEDLGLLGFGFGVEWCVDGLDRLDAYAPHCKMTRP